MVRERQAAFLTLVINLYAETQQEGVLVLDDYHLITDPAIHAAMSFLINHLPSQLHLVIITRFEPPLALARLRAQGQLMNIETMHLRFSQQEIGDFCKTIMSLNLSTKAIESLEEYSEGWIAAIQLITLSMQQMQDTGGDSVALGGKSRYLVSYLVEEVLRHQPEHIQRFLLYTALLDRLNAPLCRAITDQEMEILHLIA